MSKKRLVEDAARVVAGLALVVARSVQSQSTTIGRQACRFAKNNRDLVNRWTPPAATHFNRSSFQRTYNQDSTSKPEQATTSTAGDHRGVEQQASTSSPAFQRETSTAPDRNLDIKGAGDAEISSDPAVFSSTANVDTGVPSSSSVGSPSFSAEVLSSRTFADTKASSSQTAGDVRMNDSIRSGSLDVGSTTKASKAGTRSSVEMSHSDSGLHPSTARIDEEREERPDVSSETLAGEPIKAAVKPTTRQTPGSTMRSSQPIAEAEAPDSSGSQADEHVSYVNKRTAASRERRVPSSPTERAASFGSLSLRMLAGAAYEGARRVVTGDESKTSVFLTPQNASRLVASLCRMRGAALKVAQMISLQEEQLPVEVQEILSRVRDGADIMPRRQLESILSQELGENWQKDIVDFDYDPIASASIGQVHRAKLSTGESVALKIQYPGVARSIESDLSNIQWLAEKFDVFPKGIYMDKVIDAARIELAREVDYELEGNQQMRMRDLLKDFPQFNVPKVYQKFASKSVLVTDLISGRPLDQLLSLPQDTRNRLGGHILDLTLHELFVFRFMQTDPNWSNFLYDDKKDVMHLLDFGAARDFRKLFTDNYLDLVHAAMEENGDEVLRIADFLGFTTGDETQRLRKLHVQAANILGEPFREDPVYDFRGPHVLKGFGEIGGLVMNDRLTAPPQEAYALHRKLMGSFQSCIKLGAVVPCRKIFLDVYKKAGELQRQERSTAGEEEIPAKYDGSK